MPKRLGRNDPCPCGSGLKYKHCHLKVGGLRILDSNAAIHNAAVAATSQNSGELSRAIDTLERVRSRAELNDVQRAITELNLASALQFKGVHRSALHILDGLLRSQLSDERVKLWIELKRGVSFAALGDLEAALHCLTTAADLALHGEDLLLRGSVAMERGKVLQKLGDIDGASRLWEAALRDYEAAGDEQHAMRVRSNLAALDLKHVDPARQQRAIVILKDLARRKLALGDLAGYSTNCSALSLYYWRNRKFDAALGFARKDLSASRESGDQLETARSLLNLGRIYIDLNQPTAARVAIAEAKEIAHSLGDARVVRLGQTALRAVNAMAREAHLKGEELGAKATCACGSGRRYVDCCGRADFDPLPRASPDALTSLRSHNTGPAGTAAWLDFLLRDDEEVRRRHAWHRVEAHEGWYEVSELTDAATIHLNAARAIAAEAQDEPDGIEKPATAVILSTCALEAFANQVAFFVHEAHRDGHDGAAVSAIVSANDHMVFQRTTKLIEKWSVLGSALCGDNWPPEKALWDDMQRLVDIRNELIHFKAAEYEQIIPPPREPHPMVRRMPPAISPRPIAAAWPRRVLTPALGDWAVSVADRLIHHFRKSYERTRSTSRSQ